MSCSIACASRYEISADCYVADFGQTIRSFAIEGVPEAAANVAASDFAIITTDEFSALSETQRNPKVLATSYVNGTLTLTVDEFRMPYDFVVAYVGDENVNLSFTQSQVTAYTDVADQFAAHEGESLVYRLYEPTDATGPVPLVLWTHGAGEKGTDNWLQISANRGATGFVDYDENIVVLAPQVEEWGEAQLAEIRAIILDLIDSGKVDPNRIYGSGCSFGGRGILLNAAYNKDLFAAILPLCPAHDEAAKEAMETIAQAGVKFWVYTAFEDQRPQRHVDWMTWIKAVNDKGVEDAHITLLLPEEFHVYNLGFAENESERNNEYHHTWVLAMHNIRGCLDWMFAQTK